MQASRDREELYRLIIGQLRYDGMEGMASALSKMIGPHFTAGPSPRLAAIVQQTMKDQPIAGGDEGGFITGEEANHMLDLDALGHVGGTLPAPNFRTVFVTAHKAACRAATFSKDGKLAATGSSDASIKLLDTQKMLNKHDSGECDTRPVLKTFYDHTQAVTTLEFHPNEPMLVSGGEDCMVKFFDLSKVNVRKSARTVSEVAPIRSVAFHPAGKHLLVATDDPVVRLYDINTLQCFSTANAKENHREGVQKIVSDSEGKTYATCSLDGTIKLWDLVSSRCIATWTDAHSGADVDSICFSRNCKYILSCGKDNTAKLWDVGSGRVLTTYDIPHNRSQLQAAFSHTEQFILTADESNNAIISFDTRTGEKLRSYHGHTNTVRHIATSPSVPGFISCSDDFRARFWVHEAI